MESPITIVIPVYNRAHTLPRLLRSIDAQTLAPAAVVLVDNSSTDTSIRIMEDWAIDKPWVQVLSQPIPGAPAARNLGLKAVRSGWTMFFDSDDEMLPHHISDLSQAIADNPDADIIGKDVIIRKDGHDTRKYYSTTSPLFSHLFRSTLSTLRYIARTSLFRKAGGWNENLTGWDDFELGVRLLLQSPRLVTAKGRPGAIVHHQDESITGNDFSSNPGKWEGALDAIRKELTLAGRADALAWLDARTMILAAEYHREGSDDLAADLRDRVISRTQHPRRIRLIYTHNRIFNRLTWILAKILLP